MPATPSATILRRFRAVNRTRLLALLNSLSERQQQLMDLLPLVFHLNHPRLPGYKEEDPAPAGIGGYTPEEATLKAARAWSERFDYKPAPLAAYDIEGLFLLDHGLDAVGQRRLSLWLCPRAGLAPEARSALRRKVERVRRLAAETRLHLEIETVVTEELRSGEVLSVAWSGHAPSRDHLLLEQFYFSAIQLAGWPPLWWLVPPEREAGYAGAAAELLADRITAAETMDFGGVEGLAPAEFFRTLLWRAFSALDAPFQSLAEIFLMEVQAARYPRAARLSTVYKLAVYNGDMKTAEKSPAQLTLDVLGTYLKEQPERLELVRRSLEARLGGRRTRETPPLAELRAERLRLAAALQTSYGVILERLHHHAEEGGLDPQEIIILGRKLYALFEPGGGKLGWLNPGLTASAAQAAVSLHRQATAKGGERWLLFQGLVGVDRAPRETPARQGQGPLELLAWAYFNEVIGPTTTVALHVGEAQLGVREVQEALAALRRLFPGGRPAVATPFELAAVEVPTTVALFVNFGLAATSTIARGDQQVISDRTDALRFGALSENLISGIEMLCVTSWGQLTVERFSGRRALAECIAALLGWAGPEAPPPTVAAYCFSAAQGALITRRVEEVFNHLLAHFYARPRGATPRHLLGVGRGFYLTDLEEGRPRSRWLEGMAAVNAALAAPRGRFRGFVADPHALPDGPLPELYRHAHAGRVQLFLLAREQTVEWFVIDERGSLARQESPARGLGALVRFLTETQRRLFLWLPQAYNEEGELDPERTAVHSFTGELLLYRLRPGRHGGYRAEEMPKADWRSDAPGLLWVSRPLEGEEGHHHALYCGERCLGEGVDEEEVLRGAARALREQGIPARIEGIDAPPALLGAATADALQTIHYLNFRRRLEEGLAAGEG